MNDPARRRPRAQAAWDRGGRTSRTSETNCVSVGVLDGIVGEATLAGPLAARPSAAGVPDADATIVDMDGRTIDEVLARWMPENGPVEDGMVPAPP